MFSLIIDALLAVYVVVCFLIIIIVLMQRPKSEGLGAAFGGGMTENLFGAQTTNVLANATRWLGALFFVLTLVISILYAKQSTRHSAIQAALINAAKAGTLSTPLSGTDALSGTAALSGTEALSGTGAFNDIKLNGPAASPAAALLQPPTLGGSAADSGAATPAPGASGTH